MAFADATGATQLFIPTSNTCCDLKVGTKLANVTFDLSDPQVLVGDVGSQSFKVCTFHPYSLEGPYVAYVGESRMRAGATLMCMERGMVTTYFRNGAFE